jgi:radical SAM superfamily enzyme YgiQ (UPF0313 family)
MATAVTGPHSSEGRRPLFRMVIPAYPAFNIYSHVARKTTSLGPLCVATAARELDGWDVEVIDENNYRAPGPRDDRGMPDHRRLQEMRPAAVVGLYGGLSSTVPRLYRVAGVYASAGVPVVAGGQHFIGENVVEALANHVTVVAIGEGEATVRELLPALRHGGPLGDVAGIAFLDGGRLVHTPSRPPLTDFAALPQPDFSLLRYARVKVFPVSWTRGCGMDCEFCTVKGTPRPQSPERVFECVTGLVERHGAREFFLVDDLFGQYRSQALRLCEMLASYQQEHHLRLWFTVQTRLDRARDSELLAAMRRAGMNSLAVGFESPIEEELEAMNKKLRPAEMVRLARTFHKAGFFVHGMFIFGYPLAEGQGVDLPTRERVRRFRRFIKKARLDTVQVLLPVPLPGTEMTARLRMQNRVFPVETLGWEYYDGNFPLFEPDGQVSPQEMQAALCRIMGRFYRFRYMFAVGLHTLIFPWIGFSVTNLHAGWQRWYRHWRNSIIRFVGWRTLKHWTHDLKRSQFADKLEHARRLLAERSSRAGAPLGGH